MAREKRPCVHTASCQLLHRRLKNMGEMQLDRLAFLVASVRHTRCLCSCMRLGLKKMGEVLFASKVAGKVTGNGMYVAVIGSLKGVRHKKCATAFAVRPITDYNEVTLHFIQCVRMHIQNTKSKVGSPAHTNSSVGTPFSNSMSEAATPTFVKSNSISCAE
ncbi:replication protein A 32 kDa subunit A-like, partial [Triticum urartu]|uniref:replication protein A 32 kDa subunit A-like n=1 Tax=Triticum urartu TaxID=4572 RepID=UPI002043F1FF